MNIFTEILNDYNLDGEANKAPKQKSEYTDTVPIRPYLAFVWAICFVFKDPGVFQFQVEELKVPEDAGIASIVIENTGNIRMSVVLRYGICLQIMNKTVLILNSGRMEKAHICSSQKECLFKSWTKIIILNDFRHF